MQATQFDIDDIRRINKYRGRFFFEPATMRFFRSRIGRTVHQGPGGVFFTTSEQFDDRSPRLFTVRKFDPKTGDVSQASEFQQFGTAALAHAWASAAARVALSEVSA